jgi:nucleoside-diphosphate-sugar epimerase
MIIGNGLLASAFASYANYDDVIIFASGVSDSKETNESDFNREIELLKKVINDNQDLKIIYFSCVLADIIDNDYFNHKLNAEAIIKDNSNDYLIFRIPQIIGRTGNKNNLVNYFKNSIINGDEITIFNNTQRALIDIDDLVKIVTYCKNNSSRETLIISDIEKVNVVDVVNLIATSLNIEPKIKFIDKSGGNWDIKNSDLVTQALQTFKIKSTNYTQKIITKYINN